jgi:hypothetical protein
VEAVKEAQKAKAAVANAAKHGVAIDVDEMFDGPWYHQLAGGKILINGKSENLCKKLEDDHDDEGFEHPKYWKLQSEF